VRDLLAAIVAVAWVAVGTGASMELYDDFDSYAVGTIHVSPDGTNAPRWQVQRNSPLLGDPGWVTVEDFLGDGDHMLKITNRDLGGEVDTIYASMNMEDKAIAGLGTIYLRFAADGPNDTLLATNDLLEGWDYLRLDPANPGLATAASYQQMANNYKEMGVIVRLSGAEAFYARDGSDANPSATGVSGYKEVALGQPVRAWQELWIQIDHANDRGKFFWCLDGGEPTVVMNPDGGQWWAMRNEQRDNDSVAAVKWFIGMYPFPIPDEGGTETNVIIESIAVDTAAMTTDRYSGWEPAPDIWPCPCRADFDGDCDVDLDDFVILKSHFGTGTTHAQGDADGDLDVDLDDFVILKQEFGVCGS